MEDFRKKIQKKLNIYTFICCLYPSVLIAAKAIFKNADDFAQGLVLGTCLGAMLVSIYYLARYYSALHDEEKLKKMYVEFNDERNIAISKETMRTASTICVVVTALACIVTGFINEIISITLCADLVLSVLITVAVQAYYNKKM